MRLRSAWSSISLGVFLIALAWVIQAGYPLKWLWVVLCGTSTVGALVKGHWRWSVHPALWGAGLSYAFTNEGVSGWAAFFGLLGGSLILGWLVRLVPRTPPPPDGVIDVEVR